MSHTTVTAWVRTGRDARAPFHPRHVHHFDRDDPASVDHTERLLRAWLADAQDAGLRVGYLRGGVAVANGPSGLVTHVYTYTEDAERWDAFLIGAVAARVENTAHPVTPDRRN